MSSGIPYLGSKISLISKSEIRYEGILYTIDTKESTIALAKVRSFGTEDRPTDRPVIPRNEVYEYIIFRASDIKDLHVCEAPKHQQTLASGLPNDPAIVEHSAPVASSSGFASSTFRPPSGYGPVGALPFQCNAQQSTLPHLSQSFTQASSHHSGSRSGTPTPTPQQRKSPTIDAGVQVSSEQSGIREDGKDKKPAPRQQQHPIATTQQKRAIPARQQKSRQTPQQQSQAQSTQQQSQAQSTQQQPQQQYQPQRTRNQRRGRGQRGRQPGTNRPKEVLQFDSEFDFEQANAEFQEIQNKLGKIKIDDLTPPVDEKKDDSGNETQAGEGHEEEETYFYDKSKSFFDNISCEALARSKGNFERLDWRQERKLNVETFGVSARSNWRRNAWRGRGSRGRGPFRGGRGGLSRGGRGGGGQRTGNPTSDQQKSSSAPVPNADIWESA